MSYLVIDFGTSSCRASIISREGKVISNSREQVSVSVYGYSVEVDTEYVWSLVVSVIKHVIGLKPNGTLLPPPGLKFE